jgi:2-hydroxyglutarate dehydrogenase
LLSRYPSRRLAVIEKEDKVGQHQTGHNSGVVHAGIYYTPGSLKAKLCVEGLELSYAYFKERKIPHHKCGKLIVAASDDELARLDALYQRGLANCVKDLSYMSPSEFVKVEPHCAGVRAIYSPHTGIVDWGLVAQHYAQDVEALSGRVLLSHEVTGISDLSVPGEGGAVGSRHAGEGASEGVELTCGNGVRVRSARAIFCAGAYSDRLARKAGGSHLPMIVPVRGEYLELDESRHHLVKGLIYPVPDPSVPFLGVHFTPTMGSVTTGAGRQVLVGPNAVLAFSRQGYSWGHVNLHDVREAAAFPGLWKLGLKHWRFGLGEMYRSLVLSAQMQDINKYLPHLQARDLRRGRAGVRAQALSVQGALVDDFVFDEECSRAQLHVRNAPSPGATSALAIAKMIVDKAAVRFRW